MKLARTAVHATHSWVNMTGRWLMPKPFWLGVPLCVVLVSTQACTYSTSWQRSNETGVEAYQQGHYAEAEDGRGQTRPASRPTNKATMPRPRR